MVYSLQLDHFSIIDKTLKISVKGSFTCQRALNARISIIFDNGQETRRLPILTKSNFFDAENSRCLFHSEYNYNLPYLFWNKDCYNDIYLKFSLNCGEEYEDVILDVDDDILECDGFYYQASREDGMIVISFRKSKFKKERRIQNRSHPFYTIFTYIMFLISIVLSPFFFIEGFFAYYDLFRRSPDFENARSRRLVAILYHVNWKIFLFSQHGLGRRRLNQWLIGAMYGILRHRKVNQKQIAFISVRREDLTGNFEFIHEKLKSKPDISIKTFLNPKHVKNLNPADVIRFVNILSTSRIVLVDDFIPNLYTLKLKEETSLIQLWHAVGAFKTFGFSRLGKPGGSAQISPNHRSYDYATVSSENVIKFYAEGFGLSEEKVVATGVPRTDVFFDEGYRTRIVKKFYEDYPHLSDRKIILFAPTFRGKGKEDAFYPMHQFQLKKLYEKIDDGYAIIIKHHPFLTKRMKIPSEYQDHILDLSRNSEINDLLFVTDLLITDYSSVIFEAALLDIPMLFYAYDLGEYITSRDFYYDFVTFVPGKIVFNQQEIVKAILEQDFAVEKIEKFKNRFFDHLDGKSTERTMDLLYELLEGQ